MPKYRKGKKRAVVQELVELEAAADRRLMFKSAIITYIIAGLLLGLSIFLNSEMWTPFGTQSTMSTTIKVVDYALRGGIVALFYLFMIVAWGNTKELRGGVLELKEIAVLIGISLVQTYLDGYVFLVGTVGVVLVSIYIWFMQVKIE
jgi:hypothetical protein